MPLEEIAVKQFSPSAYKTRLFEESARQGVLRELNALGGA